MITIVTDVVVYCFVKSLLKSLRHGSNETVIIDSFYIDSLNTLCVCVI